MYDEIKHMFLITLFFIYLKPRLNLITSNKVI